MAVLVVNVPVAGVEIGIVVEAVQPASAPPALAPLLFLLSETAEAINKRKKLLIKLIIFSDYKMCSLHLGVLLQKMDH